MTTEQYQVGYEEGYSDGFEAGCASVPHTITVPRATWDAVLEALKQIEWSNDSKWQADCAREALTAANAVSAEPNKYPDLTSCPWCDSTNRTVRKIRMGIVKCAHDWHTDEQAHPQATEPACKQLLQVPEGYTLVPVNATPEMIAAAEQVEDLYRRGTPDTWGSVYRAMLAAAPEAKQ